MVIAAGPDTPRSGHQSVGFRKPRSRPTSRAYSAVMTDLLFNSGYLRDALEARNQEMISEIERVPEDHAVEADEAEWATALAERYQIEAPVLNPNSATWTSPRRAR
jgi:hypothetical protein